MHLRELIWIRAAARCADQLVRDKVLYSKSLGGGKFQYAAYNNEGEIDIKPFEDQIDKKSTSALITEELSDRTRVVDAIMLSGALKLRYELRLFPPRTLILLSSS